MNKTIWIVNQFASHLEERHLNLAANFAEKGYNVVVITTSFHHGRHIYLYEEELKVVEKQQGVTYIYLKSRPPYMTGAGKRTLHMLDFCYRFDKYRKKIAESFGKPDYVLASSAPPFVWEIGYRAAKKYGAKFIAEFRDIWPLSLVEVQGTSAKHPFVKLLEVVEKRAYKHADAIVGTMPYAYKHVCDELGFPRSKVYWMPNGLNVQKAEQELADAELKLPKELDDFLTQHWCCIYIGSIVKSERVGYMIDAWKQVKNKEICFAIIGDGNVVPDIEQQIRTCNSGRVRHFQSIPKTHEVSGNMKGLKITVVTPVYNGEEWIERCMQSIMNQTYQNFEHIVMDGGSTDNTVRIVSMYEKLYNVKVYSKKDNGMYDAIVNGFDVATGDIFCWINADDSFFPWAFDVMNRVITGTDAEWCMGFPTLWDESGLNTCSFRISAFSRAAIRAGFHDGRVMPFIQQESTFWTRKLWERSNGAFIREYIAIFNNTAESTLTFEQKEV